MSHKSDRIQKINIEDFSYEELEKKFFHFSLKSDEESISNRGLESRIGRNSVGIDQKPAIYFSYGIEGALQMWDVWLRWRLNRLNNPSWIPEYQAIYSNIMKEKATPEEIEKYCAAVVQWSDEFLSGKYIKDSEKLDQLFQYQFQEMNHSNYYFLDLKEGKEFVFDEIDVKKVNSLSKKGTKEDYTYRYFMAINGDFINVESDLVDKWNMNTILGKNIIIPPERIFQLVLSDGCDDVFSIVDYLYCFYKEKVPPLKQEKFGLLDSYIVYCNKLKK